MSFEKIEQFYQEVLQEPALQQQLESANSKETFLNIAVELGKGNGYSFDTRELNDWILAQQKTVEDRDGLSDEELETLAGGFIQKDNPFFRFSRLR